MANKHRLAKELNDEFLDFVEDRVIGHNQITSEDELMHAGKALFGKQFAGIYASDETPEVSEKKPYAIINIKPRSSGGEHWMPVIDDGEKKDLVYDSFHRPISRDHYLSTPTKDIGKTKQQQDQEENCGQRALAALLLASTDLSLLRSL